MSADGQGTKCRRNIAENFNRLSKVHERYRQTTDGRATANSERKNDSFLANVNSRSRSLYAIARPSVVCRLSVCRLSITFVRPTKAVEIFGNISTALGILAVR